MRVEDIDMARCKPHFKPDMIEDLRWFGISWTKGYDAPTDASTSIGPSYVQSQRFALYEKAWHILYSKGYIYPCKQSRRDVESALSAPHDNTSAASDSNHEPIFPPHLRPDFMADVPYGPGDHTHLPATWQDLSSPLDHRMNWRFCVPDAEVGFEDVCKGPQAFTGGKDFGDFLVWRLDGYPSYELAVVVDDVLMGVTEVVRGEDLLVSTARQLLLMKAIFDLDYTLPSAWHKAADAVEPTETTTETVENEISIPVSGDSFSAEAMGRYRLPRYFHAPLVCDEHGVRLAKRNFSKSLRKLREEGMTPEGIREQYLKTMGEHLF